MFSLALILISLSASAKTLINGISVHSELGQESFIGALFTTNLSSDSKGILLAQEEKQLQVRILAKRISARRFKRMWIEGLAINASAAELQAQSQNMANFSNMLKVSLRRGDIFAVQRSNESVKVIINGSTLGTIEDVSFFDLLLRTWIGPVPLSSQFRDGLLAAGKFSGELREQFNSTRPSEVRIEAVASALESVGGAVQTAGRASNLAAAAPAPKIEAPKIKPPVIRAPTPRPQIVQATPRAQVATPKPAPPKPVQTPRPQPKPQQTTSARDLAVARQVQEVEQALDDDESIIDTDDEEFTAESLLGQQLYIAKLKKWTYQELLYPQRSLEKGEQGTVRLSVTIKRDGTLVSVEVVEKPAFFRLTKAAVKAVRKSAPYPPLPASISGSEFNFSLPIVFRIVDE